MDADLADQNLTNEERKTIINTSDEDNLKVLSGNVNGHTEQEGAKICRICFEENSSANLLTPCECKGTIGNVHKNCLEKWLTIKNTESCDVCKHKFTVTKIYKSCWECFADMPLETKWSIFHHCFIWFLTFMRTVETVVKVKTSEEAITECSVSSALFWLFVFRYATITGGSILLVWKTGKIIYESYKYVKAWRKTNFRINIVCSVNRDDDASFVHSQVHTRSSEKLEDDTVRI